MGIFTGLFKSRDKPQNSYDSPSYTYFFGRANSGKRVTDRTALQHIAVYACVRVLSEAIAQLPLHVYQYTDHGKERVPQHPLYFLLHDQPNPEMTFTILLLPSPFFIRFRKLVLSAPLAASPADSVVPLPVRK